MKYGNYLTRDAEEKGGTSMFWPGQVPELRDGQWDYYPDRLGMFHVGANKCGLEVMDEIPTPHIGFGQIVQLPGGLGTLETAQMVFKKQKWSLRRITAPV
jgi:hypothetical protein